MEMISFIKNVLRLSVIVFFANCSGVKFAPVAPNLSMPSAYITRSVYESGVSAYDFDDLVGNILYIKKDNSERPLRVAVVRPSDYKDSIRLLTENESLNYYHSIITKGAEIQGNYLAFAANFTRDQIAEYTLMDIAQSSIKFNAVSFNEILDSLKNWVKVHPKMDTSIKRIWIKSVVLSSSLYTAGNKIKSNASGVMGPTFGVNGSVYNTSNQTNRGTIIGFDYFDVDALTGVRGSFSEAIQNLEKRTSPILLKGELRK